jgi:hypothetical protein
MGKIGLKYIIFRDLIDRLIETVMNDLSSPLPIGHKKITRRNKYRPQIFYIIEFKGFSIAESIVTDPISLAVSNYLPVSLSPVREKQTQNISEFWREKKEKHQNAIKQGQKKNDP